MPVLHIQGIDAEYRDVFPDEEILFSNLPIEDQYFQRSPIPFTDDELVAIANREHQYTDLQKKWVDKENWRMSNGVYAMIKGVLTFLPGSFYGYVSHWTLETGEKPDYRNCTRKIFILKEHLYFNSPVLAMTRGKSRRKGATSEGTYWEWWICGRNKEKIGGMISFSDDSIKKIFQMLFMRGFKAMLPCFVEEFDSNSENFIRFVKSVEKKKKGVPIKREGLNSYIDYQPTTINAYDSGRVSYLLGDEFGKWEKVDINTYWSKVKPTLTIGTKKVGFAYIPTTVNPEKKGGGNYKIFWDDANQNAINPKTGEPYGVNVPSRVVRIFDPATEGYAGCIDKYGESVIDDPVEPIMGNDGNWITEGSRTIILRERANLVGERLMEHRRDYPIDEYDMFAFLTGTCEFNEENIIRQIQHNEDNPPSIRQMRLVLNKKITKGIYPEQQDVEQLKVTAMDDENCGWYIHEMPNKPNWFEDRGSFLYPMNKSMYQIGVDTTKDIVSINGSKPVICVFKKSCIVEGVEMGLYPVAFYTDKTRLDVHFDEEVFKACLYWGCTANYEIDVRPDYWRYFSKNKGKALLEWTPKIAQNPIKTNFKVEPGTRSGDPFQFAQQLQIAKMYIDGTDPEVYNGHVHRIVFNSLLNQLLKFDNSNRTKSDEVIALMMALLPVMGEMQMPVIPNKIKELLPVYKIEKYA